jgi:hypothetical protein
MFCSWDLNEQELFVTTMIRVSMYVTVYVCRLAELRQFLVDVPQQE